MNAVTTSTKAEAGEDSLDRPGPVVWVNLVLLGLLWLDLFVVLETEWAFNEQYEFGYLVPFLAGYLVYLRWEDRPAMCPWQGLVAKLAVVLLVAGVVVLLPLRIVYESNPDWRFVYWAQGMLVFAATLLLVGLWAGWGWVRHFAAPCGMLLFAIPWFSWIEQPLTGGLMSTVATVTVEFVNLSGIHAVQKGNLIGLPNGMVGVEEACSGIRSLQSSLMSAYFLGEMFRLMWSARVALIALGLVVATLLNVARTVTLTFAVHYKGSEYMNEIHDMVGNTVAIGAFVILLGLGWLMRKAFAQGERTETARDGGKPHWLPMGTAVSLLVLGGLTVAGAQGWYLLQEEPIRERVKVDLDWEGLPHEVEKVEIHERTRAVLRYSEGEQVRWKMGPDRYATVFFFSWEAGLISSFAGVHRPDVCLPSTGHQLVGKAKSRPWTQDGFTLPLEAFTFHRPLPRGGVVRRYVYFAVWDDAVDSQVPQARTAMDRIANAFHAKRIRGRHSLQIVLTGPPSEEAAWQQAKRILEQALVVDKG